MSPVSHWMQRRSVYVLLLLTVHQGVTAMSVRASLKNSLPTFSFLRVSVHVSNVTLVILFIVIFLHLIHFCPKDRLFSMQSFNVKPTVDWSIYQETEDVADAVSKNSPVNRSDSFAGLTSQPLVCKVGDPVGAASRKASLLSTLDENQIMRQYRPYHHVSSLEALG